MRSHDDQIAALVLCRLDDRFIGLIVLKLNRLARDASCFGCIRNVAQHLRCMLFDILGMLREGFGHLPDLRFRHAEHIERRLDDQRSYLAAS